MKRSKVTDYAALNLIPATLPKQANCEYYVDTVGDERVIVNKQEIGEDESEIEIDNTKTPGTYCKFENFREGFTFAKLRIYAKFHEKNPRDMPKSLCCLLILVNHALVGIFNVANISFYAIPENKILAKISAFTVF